MITQEEIADIIYTHVSSMGEVSGIEDAADAILDALPNLIPKLVWTGFKSGPYEICVHEGGIADLFCHGERDEDGEPEMLKGGYLTLVSIDDFKAIADKHNVDTIMTGLGFIKAE
jgi:hypothetical protein